MTHSQKIQLTKIIISAVLFALSFLPFGSIYSFVLILCSYITVGFDILKRAVINIKNRQVFDENFLMTVASLGAFFIGEFSEGTAVMLFYQVGELFQDYAVNKSRNSISSLLDIRPDYANIFVDGEIKTVDPYEVMCGDIILVKPGEKIALDGIVIDGSSSVNTSALTGESLPKDVCEGDEVLSGSININGVLKIKVTKDFGESTVSKILELVENSSLSKTKTENFITKFARYYTPIVVIGALCLAFIPPIFFGGITDWIFRAMIFLVISCPCALVISVPLSFFGGIGKLSKCGILFKGSNFIEVLAKAKTVAFDKTGTLTKGNFKVSKIVSPYIDNALFITYLAHAEAYSNHPVSRAIKEKFGSDIMLDKIENYSEFAGFGVFAKVNGVDVYAGNDKLMDKIDAKYEKADEIGTVIYASINGRYAGYVVILDEIKEIAKNAIEKLKECGIKETVMLTGDSEKVANYVGGCIGIDKVHHSLLPTDKVECVKAIKEDNLGNTVFVGDGVNDAPVLALSDVGIAMGGIGSDAAIEAADVIVMDDNIEKISLAINISRRTLKIVKQNIVFALGIKLLFLILAAFGLSNMWEAVFADVGVSVIAILNAMRALK